MIAKRIRGEMANAAHTGSEVVELNLPTAATSNTMPSAAQTRVCLTGRKS
jgi:hypothetical protein